MLFAGGCGGGEKESGCSMAIKFQLCKRSFRNLLYNIMPLGNHTYLTLQNLLNGYMSC